MYSAALKMQAAVSPEMLVPIFQTECIPLRPTITQYD